MISGQTVEMDRPPEQSAAVVAVFAEPDCGWLVEQLRPTWKKLARKSPVGWNLIANSAVGWKTRPIGAGRANPQRIDLLRIDRKAGSRNLIAIATIGIRSIPIGCLPSLAVAN